MTSIEHFLWLAEQVIGSMAVLWYITLPAVAAGLLGLAWILRTNGGARVALLTVVIGATAPILLLVLGTLLRAPTAGHGGSQGYEVLTATVLCIAGFVGRIVWAKEYRLGVALHLAAWVWPLLLVAFVAAMSVSGDWL